MVINNCYICNVIIAMLNMCGEYRYESFRLVPILFYPNHCKFETFNISLRKINDMEEKKTKRMTKAEAFEYLKEKKVDASINEREVQLKLFSIGVVWCTLDSKPTLGVSYLFIDKECHMTHCGSDFNYYKTHRYEKISVDDILSIKIVEDGFNYDKVVELAKPLMAYLNEVGFRDSIRVSQFGVVHEPMSTLIFDNGIGE